MKQKLTRWSVSAILLLCSTSSMAELSATALPGDTRLVQFEYDADNTFLVLARPKSLTHIEFGADEKISTVAGGDTKNWELSPTGDRRHLFVKPIYESMETSMTVITDKRTYQFVLRSTGPGAKWYQRVTWRYGQTMLMDLRAEDERQHRADQAARAKAEEEASVTLATNIRPEDLRFGYEISGDAAFRPSSVFDDGKFTWIRMPADLNELPALFASSEGEALAVVNYVIKGEYMLAQRLMDQGVLKLGKQEVRFGRKAKRTFFGTHGDY
jgi:type IV secretion system protein VirB9